MAFAAAGYSVLFYCSQASALTLKSPEFPDGGEIPVKAGYKMGNISPCLEWAEVPTKTASFVLIVDDPDAGGWVHWIVYNIPASVRSIREGFPAENKLKDGVLQGLNSFNESAYGGPCPPSGVHRYVFKLYALDKIIDISLKPDRTRLLKAMSGHIVGEASLTATYGK